MQLIIVAVSQKIDTRYYDKLQNKHFEFYATAYCCSFLKNWH